MAKFSIGDIVLHKDGQYECEVLEIISDGDKPYYRMKDLTDGTKFSEYESYLIGDDDGYEDDGQPDEAQEWHDFDPDC